MAGDFELALVCFFYDRAQLVPGDVHIRLERSRALISPEVHHPASVVRPCQRVHHWSERTDAFQIRRSDMHLWTDHATSVNEFLDLQVAIRRHAAGGPNRSDSKCEIETRETAR